MKNEQKMSKKHQKVVNVVNVAKTTTTTKNKALRYQERRFYANGECGELMLPKVFIMKIILKTQGSTLWKTLLELNSPHSPQYFVISPKRG